MQHYTLLSELFSYPEQENLPVTVPLIKQIVKEKYPECNDKIESFLSFVRSSTLDEQREYYIRTFDVQALCYLDLGYVFFGEDYKRGEFLVNLRNEHIIAGNDCGCELADHLPNMLKLLPKIKDKAFADELAYSIMIPALKEILKNFKDEINVYKSALELLLYIMEHDFNNLGYEQYKVLNKDKTNFLDQINCDGCNIKRGR
jgi:nitrate reductase assembly molybdenum cofactor insertion protein NarJ